MAQGFQTALEDMEARLKQELIKSQTEVAQLKVEIAALRKQQELAEAARRHDAADHDREMMLKIRLALQRVMEDHTVQKRRRSWWPWKRSEERSGS